MSFLTKVSIVDPMWQTRFDQIADEVLPFQWELLNDRVPEAPRSHCIENFCIAAGISEGEHYGMVFQDSDLYKWLEAVANLLKFKKVDTLQKNAEYAISLIAKAQRPDGYINTWYQIKQPGVRWVNLAEGHELYCAGHLMEAAVAYHEATGKDDLLKIACAFADCIDSAFQNSGYPGHPEIELALFRLYQATGNERYKNLACRFIDHRGSDRGKLFEKERKGKNFQCIFPELETFGPDYFLAHKPVRMQKEATGHAVRAVYLYCAMVDDVLYTSDQKLRKACERLWDDLVSRQMYITGAIGASSIGERLTSDWDLPSDGGYAESCASVGLMLLARRMWLLTGNSKCFDVLQRALENTVLAGMGLDGHHYFYVNPLQVVPSVIHSNPSLSHVKTQRQDWFGVACCPPNIVRLILSLPGMVFANDKSGLYVLLHIASAFEDEGIKGDLKRDGDLFVLTVDSDVTDIHLRVPDNSLLLMDGGSYEIHDGYLHLHHAGGRREYSYRLTKLIRCYHADPRVSALSGQVCVMRGLTVYCVEEADNQKALGGLRIPPNAQTELQADGSILIDGFRVKEQRKLYSADPLVLQPKRIRLIPYRDWGNRGEGEMRVWLAQI